MELTTNIQDDLESERARAYAYAFPGAKEQGFASLESRRSVVGRYIRHVLQVKKEKPELLQPYHLQAALDLARAPEMNFPETVSVLEPMVKKLENEILEHDLRGRPGPKEVGWLGKLLFGALVGVAGYGISRATRNKKE